MRKLILLFILFLASCERDALIQADCELTPCYSGPPNTLGVGVCKAGRSVCDKNRQLIKCEGEVIPSPELCSDTEDKDCSGAVGDNLSDTGLRDSCGGHNSFGICRPGVLKCIEHQLICDGEVLPEKEDCSGRDLNCDGVVNNIEVDQPFCYTGPIGTAGVGTCHPGVTKCDPSNLGQTICEGEVLPSKEICGSGLDSDCNGVIDPATDQLTDILFIIDNGYSAFDSSEVADLTYLQSSFLDWKQSILNFISLNLGSQFRYGLITYPANNDLEYTRISDLVSGSSIAPIISNLTTGNSSAEYIFDVLYSVSKTSTIVDWRSNARKVVIHFVNEELGDAHLFIFDTSSLINNFNSNNIHFFVFTDLDGYDDWNGITRYTNGRTWLMANADQMTLDMKDIFQYVCR